MIKIVISSRIRRILLMRILLLVMFYQAVSPAAIFAAAEISSDTVALEASALSPDSVAVEAALPKTYKLSLPAKTSVTKVASSAVVLTADSPAVENISISADSVAVAAKPAGAADLAEISPDDIAVESNLMPVRINEPQRIKTPPAQIVQYARNFW